MSGKTVNHAFAKELLVGLAGAEVGTLLREHTSVGPHTMGSLGGLDSFLTGDNPVPWSERTSDAMTEDWNKGGAINKLKSVGNALELAGFATAGAVGGLAGGAADAAKWTGRHVADAAEWAGGGIADAARWAGGGIADAAGAVGGGISDAAQWAGGGIADAAGAVGGGISDAASFVGGGISDAASAVWDWL